MASRTGLGYTVGYTPPDRENDEGPAPCWCGAFGLDSRFQWLARSEGLEPPTF